MAKLTKEDIIATIEQMSMLEIKEMIEAIEEKFGVSAAAPVAVAAADAGAEAKSDEVTVMLTGDGGAKVAVIKAIREILGLGLIDAKKMVESAPVAVKENITAAEADELKAKLTEAGAQVEIK